MLTFDGSSFRLAADDYFVLESYKAESEAEVDLRSKEVVKVMEKVDGWWFCQLQSGAEGWYVRSLE